MKKIKRNYQKAIYNREEATALFRRQRINPDRWSLTETKKWWRFILR